MLRIHVRSFARRNAKKLRIEFVDLIKKAGSFNESFSGDPWLRIIISLHIPSIGRHIGDRVPAFDQQLPKGIGVAYPAGKAASNSYDGDAVFVHKGSVSRRPDDKQVIFMATQREMFCVNRQGPGALVIDGRIGSIIRNSVSCISPPRESNIKLSRKQLTAR